MAIYTHTFDLNVQGKVESSTQGTLIGSVDIMPSAEGRSGLIILYNGSDPTYEKGKYYISNGSTWSLAANNVAVDAALDKESQNPISNMAVSVALDEKQNKLSGGTGVDVIDDTVSLADSGVTAGQKGSTTSIPVITVDSKGRVTAMSDVKIYPPITAGNTGQYWKSDGNGTGVWTTPATAATSGSDTLISSGGVYTELEKKVSIVTGKDLSTNDFSDTYKSKLDGIAAKAQVNVIENVKVNNSPLTVSSKTVNIDLSKYATLDDLSASTGINIEVVDSLPTENISTSTIYLVPVSDGIYNKYVYSNSEWVMIGSTETDLSEYAKKENVISELAVSGRTITYTMGNGTTGTITTQDTNTDTMTAQSSTTDSAAYPILLKNGTGTGSVTKSVLFNAEVTITPSSGLITAKTFKGALTGNADSATTADKASHDSDGKLFSEKYATKAELKAVEAGQLTISGAASTIVSNNLSVSRAVISDSSGKIAVSPVTSTELAYLDGVTGNIQTQLGGKQDKLTATGSTSQPIFINSSGVPTVCSYTLGQAASKAVVTSVVDGSSALVTSEGIYMALQNKMDVTAIDDEPKSGSSNLVKSGGVYSVVALKQDVLTFDETPSATSENPVKSKGIYSAIAKKQDAITVSSAEPDSATGSDGDLWAVYE